MGCCFSTERDGEQTSLLSYRPPNVIPYVTQTKSDVTAVSARSHRPSNSSVADKHEPIPINIKPVKVADVDKRLQDHAHLYNEQVERRRTLVGTVRELRHMFPDANPEKDLPGCFQHIRELCKDVPEGTIQVKRRYQHCMEIIYEGKELEPTVIPAFMAFNKANKLIKDIIDKGPPLVNSVQMVVDNEKELKRDVLVASLGADGPDCMKNCIDNVNQLRTVSDAVDDMKTEATSLFEELKSAVQLLLIEETE